MKKLGGHLMMLVITVLFSFLLTLQLRSVKINTRITSDAAAMRATELQYKLMQKTEENEALAKQLLEYKDELQHFRDEASKSGDLSEVLEQQLTKVEIVAGITDVTGPGLEITMEDSKITVDTDPGVLSEEVYIIHDSDILMVINELRDAGAEAISLNGERLLATSEIRCAGSIVSVNNNRYASPYVIKAIGNSQNLESALNLRGGVKDSLAQWGIYLEIEKKDSLTINGYKGAVQFKYAVPTK